MYLYIFVQLVLILVHFDRTESCKFVKNSTNSPNTTVEICDPVKGCPQYSVCVYNDINTNFECCNKIPKLRQTKRIVGAKEIKKYRLFTYPSTDQPRTCKTWINGNAYSNCPPGYICVIIYQLGASYCCYANQQPEALSPCSAEYGGPRYGQTLPSLCDPSAPYACPNGQSCRYSAYYRTNICCSQSDPYYG